MEIDRREEHRLDTGDDIVRFLRRLRALNEAAIPYTLWVEPGPLELPEGGFRCVAYQPKHATKLLVDVWNEHGSTGRNVLLDLTGVRLATIEF